MIKSSDLETMFRMAGITSERLPDGAVKIKNNGRVYHTVRFSPEFNALQIVYPRGSEYTHTTMHGKTRDDLYTEVIRSKTRILLTILQSQLR